MLHCLQEILSLYSDQYIFEQQQVEVLSTTDKGKALNFPIRENIAQLLYGTLYYAHLEYRINVHIKSLLNVY